VIGPPQIDEHDVAPSIGTNDSTGAPSCPQREHHCSSDSNTHYASYTADVVVLVDYNITYQATLARRLA
jgi:hypothetical protein